MIPRVGVETQWVAYLIMAVWFGCLFWIVKMGDPKRAYR
jgi:hypothetical protein